MVWCSPEDLEDGDGLAGRLKSGEAVAAADDDVGLCGTERVDDGDERKGLRVTPIKKISPLSAKIRNGWGLSSTL